MGGNVMLLGLLRFIEFIGRTEMVIGFWLCNGSSCWKVAVIRPKVPISLSSLLSPSIVKALIANEGKSVDVFVLTTKRRNQIWEIFFNFCLISFITTIVIIFVIFINVYHYDYYYFCTIDLICP